MNGQQRRPFTPEEKLAIVLEGLRGDTEVSAVCRRHGISSNRFYKWRDRVFSGARGASSGRPEQASYVSMATASAKMVPSHVPVH
ncbi:MAG: transposase [Planctomycetota bacterium]|jgi:transposase